MENLIIVEHKGKKNQRINQNKYLTIIQSFEFVS